MSRLERFIENNRDSFNDKVPSGKVWDSIEAAIVKKEEKKVLLTPFYKWGIAAGLVLMISVAFLLMRTNTTTPAGDTAKKEDVVDSSIYRVAPDEAPQMVQFARLIETRQKELKVLAKEQPQLYRKFTKDLDQLDSSYNTLKGQLSATPNKEMLIEAMIQNLQLQLNVLNQQLNIINQIKQSKKHSNEKDVQFM